MNLADFVKEPCPEMEQFLEHFKSCSKCMSILDHVSNQLPILKPVINKMKGSIQNGKATASEDQKNKC